MNPAYQAHHIERGGFRVSIYPRFLENGDIVFDGMLSLADATRLTLYHCTDQASSGHVLALIENFASSFAAGFQEIRTALREPLGPSYGGVRKTL